MLTLAIASCYSDVNRPPLSTTDNKTKDKYNFSKKTYFEYTDEFGNYLANGYGYRPDPMNCQESYNLELSNTQDEQISVYLNNNLLIRKVTPDFMDYLYLNDYLSNGKNTLRYEVFNKTGGYSWKVVLKKWDGPVVLIKHSQNTPVVLTKSFYKSSFKTKSIPTDEFGNKLLINDILNNQNDTSRQNQIVWEQTIDFDVCKNSGEPPATDGPYITDTEYYPHGKNVNYSAYTFGVKNTQVCEIVSEG